MKNISVTLPLMILAFFTTTAMADRDSSSHHRDGLHGCLKAASSIKDGYYAKVEYLTMTPQGGAAYEIEIHDKDNVEWELMCDSATGNITEIEREVDSAGDPLFKRNMKVDKDTAARTALELYAGKLVHTEYEIEANGDSSYEFDIYDRPGTTYKVEVDAATGKIVEMAIERWDIGRESGED